MIPAAIRLERLTALRTMASAESTHDDCGRIRWTHLLRRSFSLTVASTAEAIALGTAAVVMTCLIHFISA